VEENKRVTELWQRSATELAAAIRDRQLSSRELISTLLDRIDRLNGDTNAFALIDVEGAMKAAAAADEALARGEKPGPLHGIPVTVKDLVATAGMRTAMASHVFADNIPTTDAEAVARIRRAGGLILGKTTTPELGHKVLTDSPLHGVTRNPWALDRTSGGSSGGAAVSVAMGFGPLALCTDGAGSARIPAACCGIVGLKPTVGAVPHENTTDLFGNLTCLGSMARTVEDVVLLHNVMAGPYRHDPWSLAGSAEPLALAADRLAVLKGLRIRWMPRTVNSYLDPDIEARTTRAVEAMVEAGARIVDEPESIDWSLDASLVLMRAYQAARSGHVLEKWRDRMDPTLVSALEEGLSQDIGVLQKALAERTALYRRVQGIFDHADILITPTVASPPLPATQRADEPLVVDGKPLGPLRRTWYCYTVPFNPAGNPAMSVPCGFTHNGLPIGLQIAGPWHSEQRLVAVAAALQELVPWREYWPSAARDRTAA
jgi:aspartyl-tRNA(Asn)/glutamyl-tRNA(Gln) amidotransferase subunit A